MADENVAKNESREVGREGADLARVSFLQQIVPSGTIRPGVPTAESQADVAPSYAPTPSCVQHDDCDSGATTLATCVRGLRKLMHFGRLRQSRSARAA